MSYDVILSSEAKQALDDHVHFIAVEKLEPVNAPSPLKHKSIRDRETRKMRPVSKFEHSAKTAARSRRCQTLAFKSEPRIGVSP
jgi:hypothetical protein